MVIFFCIFEIIIFCFVIAICDLVLLAHKKGEIILSCTPWKRLKGVLDYFKGDFRTIQTKLTTQIPFVKNPHYAAPKENAFVYYLWCETLKTGFLMNRLNL